MPSTYVQDARQRFTEFGGFVSVDPAELPESVATWADAVLERAETGLITLVALLTVAPEGAMKSVRDDLTIMADRIARQEKTEVQVLLLIITGETLNRTQYDRWQELKVNRGGVRLVPWVVDLPRQQVFPHQGPPFGIDPDLETLAAPEPRCEEQPGDLGQAQEQGEGQQPGPHGQTVSEPAFPVPWVTIALIGSVVLVWTLMSVMGGSIEAAEWSMELLYGWGVLLRPNMWEDAQYWRLFTTAFIHFGLPHIAMNSMSLWNLGRVTEWLYGPARMIFIYLVAGVMGSLASAVFGQPAAAAAGASGAILGLFGAIIWFRLSSPLGKRIRTQPLVISLVLTAGLGIVGYRMIDNWAHAGGLVGGLFAAAVVGVPAVAGKEAPRFRLSRPGRIVGAAVVTAALAAMLLGLVVPPGQGRELAMADLAYKEGRYAEAVPGFERAVKRQEDEPWLRAVLVDLYLHEGKCSQARSHFLQLQSRHPGHEYLAELEGRIQKQCR